MARPAAEPRRGPETESPGGVERRRVGTSGLFLTSGGRPLSREDGGPSRERWRCRGDRAAPPGPGVCESPARRARRGAGAGRAGPRGGGLTDEALPSQHPGKGEEQMGCTHSGPKAKERSVDSLSSKSAEGPSRKEGAATQQVPARGVKEKPGAKVTSGRNRVVIPKIVITSASNETLTCAVGSPEQRTIHEEMEWGPYARHRNPSTIDAYALQTKE